MNLILEKKKLRVHAIFSSAVFFLLMVTFNSVGQEPPKRLKKADNWFNAYNYTKALDAYLKLEKQGESVYYVTQKIADCYRLLDQPTKAVEWYQKAIAFPDVEKETYYYLGKELKKLKRYDEAEKNIERYRNLAGKPLRINGLSTEDYLMTLKSDSALWSLFNLSINTPASEFGPVIYNNQMIFSSNRTDRAVVNRRDVRNRQPFFDLYTSTLLDLTSFGKTQPFAPKIWSSLNDGPVAFSSDGLRMFVTTNVQNNSKNQQQNLDIVVYNLVKGEWSSRPAYLPLREKGNSIMHPVFAPDGSRLFFASDMPGGYGGLDLYYSEHRSGFLSSPVNLGPKINTPGNEAFPFISRNGNLYFASDGHIGIGGLDIFVAQWEGEDFSASFNAGAPLNSPFDDFSIWLTPDESSGYFASNRPGGKGEDDLYAFTRDRPIKYVRVDGQVIEEGTENPLDQTYITLTSKGLKFGEWVTGPDGKFEIYLKAGDVWSLSFMKRLFKPLEKEMGPDELSGKKAVDIKISLTPR